MPDCFLPGRRGAKGNGSGASGPVTQSTQHLAKCISSTALRITHGMQLTLLILLPHPSHDARAGRVETQLCRRGDRKACNVELKKVAVIESGASLRTESSPLGNADGQALPGHWNTSAFQMSPGDCR
jgi:hypothetical protein